MEQASTELSQQRAALSAEVSSGHELRGHAPRFSLGGTVLSCNGIEHPGPVVVALNFVTGLDSEGGHPVAPLPEPMGDIYCSFLAVPALDRHNLEHALTLPLQPGLEDYYREVGLLSPLNQVTEVPWSPGPAGQLGYPYSDAIFQAARQGIRAADQSYLAAAFPSETVSRDAQEAGISIGQRSNAAVTNNKAVFREEALQFGYPMVPGIVLDSEADIGRAVERFSGASRVWFKLDRGSAGDTLFPVDGPLTEEAIDAALARLRATLCHAFSENDYGPGAMERFWPGTSRLPVGGRVLIEQDVRDLGRDISTGSVTMVVSPQGFELLHVYRQRVGPDGDYRGSEPVAFDPALWSRLTAQLQGVWEHCCAHGLFGVVGVDHWELTDAEGEPRIYLTELNGRPSISSVSTSIASKLGAENWINVNVWHRERELNTLAEWEAAMTIRGYNFLRGDLEGGMVVPQALRALYTLDGDGERQLVRPSNAAKVLIAANSAERTEEILHLLEQNGFSLKSCEPQSAA